MIYKLLSSGLLESYRFGSSYRVSEEQLSSYLAEAKNAVKKVTQLKRHF